VDFDKLVPHPLDEEADGGIAWNSGHAYVKEMRKWEQFPSEWTVKSRPGNPYVFREYPKMLYKAQRMPNGQYACLMPAPDPYAYERPDQYQRAILFWESFNRSCYRTVDDESQERLAKGQGWALDAKAAMELHEKEQQAIGNAASEAAWAAQRMTEKARAELASADGSTHQHVTDVTGVPASAAGSEKRTKGRAVVADPSTSD
jgi:hypothetical protein